MRVARLLLQALYLGLLLAAAGWVLSLSNRDVPPGLIFMLLAVYAHGAARLLGATGADKARLCLEALPFFALAVVHLGRLGTVPALLVVLGGAVAGAAILAFERLWIREGATFLTSLGFLGLCGLAGWGLGALPAAAFLGSGLLALVLAGYGLARRARA